MAVHESAPFNVTSSGDRPVFVMRTLASPGLLRDTEGEGGPTNESADTVAADRLGAVGDGAGRWARGPRPRGVLGADQGDTDGVARGYPGTRTGRAQGSAAGREPTAGGGRRMGSDGRPPEREGAGSVGALAGERGVAAVSKPGSAARAPVERATQKPIPMPIKSTVRAASAAIAWPELRAGAGSIVGALLAVTNGVPQAQHAHSCAKHFSPHRAHCFRARPFPMAPPP